MKQEKKLVRSDSDALLMGVILISCVAFVGLTALKLSNQFAYLLLFLMMGAATAEVLALKIRFSEKIGIIDTIYIALAAVLGLIFNFLLSKAFISFTPTIEKFNLDLVEVSHYKPIYVYGVAALAGVALYLFKRREALLSKETPKKGALNYLRQFKLSDNEPDSVLIGKNLDTKKDEFLFQENLKRHVHIIGGTGTGKTNLLKNLIEEKVQEGKSVIFIDMKADKELYTWIKNVHLKYKRDYSFKYLSSSDVDSSLKINPIKRRDFNDIKNIIMNAMEWSEQFYKVQSEQALNAVLGYFQGIDQDYKEFICLEDVLSLLTNKEFFESLEKKHAFFEEDELKIDEFIKTLYSKEAVKNISGLISNLKNIKHSKLGTHLFQDCETDGNVRDQIQGKKFLFIQLNAMKDKATSKVMGKLLLNDIVNSIGDCNANGEEFSQDGCSLIIDEASDFFNEDFIDLPNKCRSSGLQLIIAHQIIADLQVVSDSFQKRLMGNMGTKIFFGTNEDEEPEMIARAIGTQKALKRTNVFNENTTEKFGSVRETDEFIIHPNDVRGLGIGEIIMVRRLYKAGAFKIKVKKASEIVVPPRPPIYKESPEQAAYRKKLAAIFQ